MSLKHGEIIGIAEGMTLETMGGEEVFVCDYDAIMRGHFNFRLYAQISKFFEVTLMNLPVRASDLIDSLISGASRVVLPGDENPEVLGKMLEVTDDIVLPAGSPSIDFFLEKGGKYLISERQVNRTFATCYNVGPRLDSKNYVDIIYFPENLLQYIY